jgi:hypothetical protein
LSLLGILCCLSAKATEEQLLWWLVEPDDVVEDWYGSPSTVSAIGATDARLRVDNASGDVIAYLDFYVQEEGSALTERWSGVDGWEIPVEAFAIVDGYTSAEYSFAVELGNYANGAWVKTLASSDPLPYASIREHIGVWNGIQPELASTWIPSSYSVPEPSSGLLMVIGGALLALRRGSRKVRKGQDDEVDGTGKSFCAKRIAPTP